MTITLKSPAQQIPAQTVVQQKVADTPTQGSVSQVTQTKGGKVDQDGGAVPTAGSPVQEPVKESWFKRNIKLVGILGGAAVGGAIGFLTLGPIGGLGGAAVGALAGYFLTKNRGTTTNGAPPTPPTVDGS